MARGAVDDRPHPRAVLELATGLAPGCRGRLLGVLGVDVATASAPGVPRPLARIAEVRIDDPSLDAAIVEDRR